MGSEFDYPQYRKYHKVDTWFKIISALEFMEVARVGDQVIRHHVIAEKFPEKIFIQDMLECKDGRWQKIDKEEFEKVYNQDD